MKRNIICLICVIFMTTNLCYTQEYSMEEAKRYAAEILHAHALQHRQISKIRSLESQQTIDVLCKNTRPYLYIVNTTDSSGWVILANEQSYSSAIIAYSNSGYFSKEHISPAIEDFLQEHMDAIDSVRLYNKSSKTTLLTITKIVYQSPILLAGSMWNQESNNDNSIADCNKVYNKFCPKRPNWDQDETCGRYLLGCGGVAMGQIMRYWHWPDNAVVGNKKVFYDWDNMPLSITNNTPMYQVDAVASLLRQCGLAAGSAYTGSGTSATIHQIVPALRNTFSYSASYFTANTWEAIVTKLMGELDAPRPVLCQAFNSKAIGHTFVIDGYELVEMSNGNNDVYFHINWGWGWSPSSEAYYNIDFNDHYKTRTFVTELYPTCSKRDDDVILSNNLCISANNVQNYYSGNNISVGGTSSIVVDNGGHLILEAGNSIRLSSGFSANTSSEVRLSIRSWCKDLSGYQMNHKKMAEKNGSADSIDVHDDSDTISLPACNVHSGTNIDHYFVYDISGRMMFRSDGENLDISALPKGFYAIQTIWEDGSVSIEKVMKY